MARTPKAPAAKHKHRNDTPAVVAPAARPDAAAPPTRTGARTPTNKKKQKKVSSSKGGDAVFDDDLRAPSPTPSPWRSPPTAATQAPDCATDDAPGQKPKASLFGFSRSPHTSFNVDDILQQAATSQKSPITNKAELAMHKEISRRPCPILSEYRKKDKLAAMGCRWDKDLKTWTTTNINLAREHRDVIIFVDGFLPPRCVPAYYY
jgi:hypothetical protein